MFLMKENSATRNCEQFNGFEWNAIPAFNVLAKSTDIKPEIANRKVKAFKILVKIVRIVCFIDK